jgi:hypothetical protein
MNRAGPPEASLTTLLEEEGRVVATLADLCGRWRAGLAGGIPLPEQGTMNSIDTLCMRFGALENEVSRLLETHGWARGEIAEAIAASKAEGSERAHAALLAAIRDLGRVNFINACLLDRWSAMNKGLFHAILAAVSPTYVPSVTSEALPRGARLSVEA